MRIGFVHPDLGIGGAERLVVDAAVSLQRRGHDVAMFTSRHDPKRCFEETRDGTLPVHVLGSSLPRQLHPKFPCTIVFSLLRSILLTFLLWTSLYLPPPKSPFNPLSPIKPFDVFIVDQQSVCVPLLKWFVGSRVVFYCHFPDKLLSGGWEIEVDQQGEVGMGLNTGIRSGVAMSRKGVGLLKRIYRYPIDKLEEITTGQADIVLSNSKFTSRVYARAFHSLSKRSPRVVYPCIDIDAYSSGSKKQAKGKKGKGKMDPDVALISSDRPTLLSLNRFEKKKHVSLAIEAFVQLGPDHLAYEGYSQLRLVIAGGYDSSEADNVETLSSLQALCDAHSLSHHTLTSSTSPPPPESTQVLFILNFTTAQRTALLQSPTTLALLYTPANEHFGIVPIEAMACGLPVLAADSGGPTETIVDFTDSPSGTGTGILRPPSASEWTEAMLLLLRLPSEQRAEISEAAQKRVREKFSSGTLGKELEEVCVEAVAMGDVHVRMGDTMIWVGGYMMGCAAVTWLFLAWWYTRVGNGQGGDL
ncbi:hypothetical protein P7C73_g293, partial [Tremellales sp. Uapishka_1]